MGIKAYDKDGKEIIYSTKHINKNDLKCCGNCYSMDENICHKRANQIGLVDGHWLCPNWKWDDTEERGRYIVRD